MTAFAGLLAIASAVLLAAWRRERAEATRLRGRLEQSTRDLENLQLSFSRFAPDDVIERVIAEGVTASGEKREVTVLFADLVGFTALSEQLDPTDLVRVLNGYFERMSIAITEHRGHVSKFIGDGILALFGALEPNPWQGNDAVYAALAMRAALVDYNRELAADGLPELSVGIGIQRGSAVAGLVGSSNLMEFTVVGRTVNLAARVQDLTRSHDADILITSSATEGLDPRFAVRAVGEEHVKGITERVKIFSVDGFQTENE